MESISITETVIVNEPAKPRPKGIACPECACRLVCTSRRYPTHGLKIRYLVCKSCGLRARSEERLMVTRPGA